MNSLSRRSFLKITGSALGAVALAACAAPAQPVATESGAAGPAAGPVEIRYLTTLTQPERLEGQELLIQKFHDANPNISVMFEQASWGEAQTKLLAMVAANDAPDVSTAGTGWPVLFAAQEAVRAVDDVIEIMGGRDVFFATELAPDFYEGKQWAMPLYQTPDVMIYRTDYYEAAGVIVPDIATDYAFDWDQYLAAAESTTTDDYFGITEPVADLHGYNPIWGLMLTNGVTIFDETGNLVFDTPETVEVYQYVADLYAAAAPPGMSSYQMGDSETAFRTGKAAATILNTGLIRTIALNEPETLDVLGVTPVPVRKEPGSFKGMVKLMLYKTEGIEAANQFVQFFFKTENYVPFLLSYAELMLPSTPEAAEAESYINAPEFDPTRHLMGPAISTLAYAAGVAQKYGASPYAGAIEGNLVIQNVLIDIMTQGTPVEQAVTKGEAAIRDIMEA